MCCCCLSFRFLFKSILYSQYRGINLNVWLNLDSADILSQRMGMKGSHCLSYPSSQHNKLTEVMCTRISFVYWRPLCSGYLIASPSCTPVMSICVTRHFINTGSRQIALISFMLAVRLSIYWEPALTVNFDVRF